MSHIMLDLETLDTRRSAIVLSIGAVRFDPNSSRISSSIYLVPNQNEQRAAGRTESLATLAWWREQTPQAREVLTSPSIPVLDALSAFTAWLSQEDVDGVWGNSVAFDNEIIRSLYESFNLDAPWPFWIDRCFRTVKAIGKTNGVSAPPFLGVPHNAVDDAFNQAAHLQRIVEYANVRV